MQPKSLTWGLFHSVGANNGTLDEVILIREHKQAASPGLLEEGKRDLIDFTVPSYLTSSSLQSAFRRGMVSGEIRGIDLQSTLKACSQGNMCESRSPAGC